MEADGHLTCVDCRWKDLEDQMKKTPLDKGLKRIHDRLAKPIKIY